MSQVPSDALLSATDRDKLAKLQLYARQVVEGITVGMHRSPHKGFSVEFKEHRPYVRGDEIRTIDWKLYGKTDRLYIRQYEEETNLRCTILVDQSGSMAYGAKGSTKTSKHDFGVRLAACLAYMLVGQQDSVGLVTFDTEMRNYIPPRSKPSHLRSLLGTLAASKPNGETAISEVLTKLVPKIRKRGLLVLISDCFDEVDNLLRTLSYFRHARNDVVVFQVWDRDELEFPFRGRTQFRSLELASHMRLLDSSLLRKSYLENLAKFRTALSAGCGKQKIDLISCTTDQPHASLLASYLAARGRSL
ncbi:MAG: DUF58 domain-containing protein [Pirellulaceae bacterium]|nr:DUF58 domain-containing protein [Pirellulaceae bacterium]